jgi:hypothetical protein
MAAGGSRVLSISEYLTVSAKEASMLLRSIRDIMPDAIAQRLAELPGLSKPSLCELWKELFKAPPPTQLRRRLMIQILAYRL